MSLKRFLQSTRLLLEQAMYEARHTQTAQFAPRAVSVGHLEERLLFSASPVAVVAQIAEVADPSLVSPSVENQDPLLADMRLLDVVAGDVLPPDSQDAMLEEGGFAVSGTKQQTMEVVFIDSAIGDVERLIDDLTSSAASDSSRRLEFVILDQTRDGLAQITSALLKFNGVDGLHIVSHGDSGKVQLGSTSLSLNNLSKYESAIRAWQYAMSDEADILIYGCNLAADATGRALLNELSELTGADVAASEDLTGHANLGGDWDLEYEVGQIDASIVVTEGIQQSWYHVLAASNLTGAWTGTAPAIASTPDSAPVQVSTTVSSTAGGTVTINGTGNLTTNSFFSNAYVEGTQSLDMTLTWDTSPESSGSNASNDSAVMTVTFTFDSAVVNPILHIDRLGGSGSSTSNSSEWTVTTSGATFSKLAGVGHLDVTSTKFSRTPNVSANSNSEASSNSSSGTAAGSIQVNGTFTTLTFEVTGIGVEGAGGDGIELAWEAIGNHAPVLTGDNDLTTINEDNVTSSGTLVSTLISGHVTDSDSAGPFGMAVTSVDNSSGTWQYTTNGGTNWNSFGSVSTTSARLLASNGSTSVRFVPNANWNGTVSNGLTFHAWDQSSGSNGSTANINVTTSHTVLDQFNATTYTGNDGSANWSTNWIEAGESDGATAGLLQVSGSGTVVAGPHITIDMSTAGSSLTRTADLSGATSAILTFNYEQQNSSAGGDMLLEIFNGTSWSTLHQYDVESSFYIGDVDVFQSFDISAHVASNTQIRFRTSQAASGDSFYIDDIQIAYTTSSVGGGSSAYSTASASSSIVVSPVNDAPVLTPYAPGLPLTEDSAPFSATVASLLGGSVSDVDSGAVEGIAVVGTSLAGGTLEYTIDGTNWFNVGTVASNNALLLRPTDQLRFTPNGANGGTVTVTYRAWDQTSGTAGSKVNASVTGGTTAFSSATDAATVTISSVNDSPTITNGSTVVLTGTNEDTTSSGTTASTILTASSWADVDTAAVSGLAITGRTGNGTWQYSTDGVTWAGFGAVSSTNALLITSTSQVRYIPDANNGETATFTYKAWDQTSGTASTNATPAYATTASNGGSTAFSTGNATASITVTSVNDAPTITNGATATLTGTTEDTTSSGTTAATILTNVGWADIDTAALSGMAITAQVGNGTWQYSTDGVTWRGFGAVSATNALLINSTTQVRYIPDGANPETATFNFVAWDQTSGTASTNATPAYANPGAGGGTSAYSSQSSTASITVSAVNDAPTITNGANVVLAGTNEDTTSSGTTASTILTGSSWADVDNAAVSGLAITGRTGNGTWQYSTDGTTWAGFGAVSSTNALLITSTTQVRYIPDADNGETATFTYKAWDQTSGTASTNGTPAYATTASNGGTTAFSTGNGTASITVTSVNDAPTISNGATATLTSTNENTTSSGTAVSSILSSVSWADVDTAALRGMAITSQSGNGTWQYSTDAITWQGFGAVSSTNALLITFTTQVRYIPDGSNPETATFGFVAWDQTTDTASTNATPAYADPTTAGGTTAYSTSSATASMTITQINDAPTITNGTTITLTSTDEDTTSVSMLASSILTTSSWADPDTGAVNGLAITGKTGNGTWQYSTDGVTWASFGSVSTANSLLITPSTQVRYIPDADNGETATFNYKAWDQTSGSASTNGAPSYASTAAAGGATAFSTSNGTTSITVTSVNDAPTITNGATATLTSTNENTTSSGRTAATILTGVGWADVDTSALRGLAITSQSGNGTWQYSTDGVTWQGLGAVSTSNALLINATTQVRYIPDSLNGETAFIGFVAWDQTTGTASTNATPSYVDPTPAGGTTAYSTQSASASITITPVNDAPVLDNTGTMTLTTITEDQTTNGGHTVAAIIATAGGDRITDVDNLAVEGIALTGTNNGNGTWQYSLNSGSTWNSVGTVTNTSALLLRATDLIRFVPNGMNATTGDITFRAWDQATGTAGTKVSTAANGGTSAFSTATESAAIVVTDLNDAPVLNTAASPKLVPIDENAPSPTGAVGTLISSLIDYASPSGQLDNASDVDTIASIGVAITATDATNGTWFYSTDDGANWSLMGTPTNSAALLLIADANNRIYFQPDPSFNGIVPNAVTFRAWDLTSGSNGTTADTTTNGGTTAFSTATDTASIEINDAPVLDNSGDLTFTTINEDYVNNPGDTVADLLASGGGTPISDPNTGAVQGIAVTATTNGNGSWQYSTNVGSTWTAVGVVSDASALLLRPEDMLRFIPDAINGTTGDITFRAWDQFVGTPGSKADASVNGGTTGFSAQTETAEITVTDVNDAPTMTSTASPALDGQYQDSPVPTGPVGTLISSLIDYELPAGQLDNASDIDNGAVLGMALIDVDASNGVWYYTIDNGANWNLVGSPTVNAALLLAADAGTRLYFLPNPSYNGVVATAITYRAWDLSSGVNGGTADTAVNGGTTAFSIGTDTASLPINDAPVLDNTGTMTFTSITEDDINNGGQTIASIIASAGGDRITDVNSGALEGIAIIGTNEGTGTWEYSTDGGSSWTAVGVVAETSGLLLRDDQLIRFVPNGERGTTGDITFRAWDRSLGFSGTKIDTSLNGDTSPFSADIETAAIIVTDLNDAPVLDNTGTMTLTTITEEDTSNSGHTVGSIILAAGGDRITDVDLGPIEGMAITATNSGNGTWEYSINAGSSWTDMGSISESTALLLRDTDLVRFVPDTENATTANFTFRAWDQINGSFGTKVDVTTNGGVTSYSTATETVSITVTAVNDAPTLSFAGQIDLTVTNEDTTSVATTVSTILTGGLYGDVDTGDSSGIAVTSTTGNGRFQYSTDGVTWTDFAAVTTSNAMLLTSTSQVRFIPDNDNGETAAFTFVAWDQTTGSASSNGTPRFANPGAGGGTTAFSTQTGNVRQIVTSVNDAPTITNGANVALAGTSEDATSSGTAASTLIASVAWADVDIAAINGIAITSVTGNGTWQYSTDAITWNGFGAVTATNALLITPTTQVRYIPDGLNGETATFGFKAWDQTTGTASTNSTPAYATTAGSGGTSAFSASNATASIIVSAVNDAPVLDNTGTTCHCQFDSRIR